MDPLSLIPQKLAARDDLVIQVISDSLGQGNGDGANLDGWVGRLGRKLAARYDCSYRIKRWDTAAYGPWDLEVVGESGNTISIYNGSVGGQGCYQHTNWLNSGNLIQEQPDLVIHGSVANDFYWNGINTHSAYYAAYNATLAAIFDKCPDVPVVVTSQTPFDTNYFFVPTILSFRLYWMVALMGLSGPPAGGLNPPYQETAAYPGQVWYWDTQQSLGVYSPTYYADNLHPNAAGYEVQAQWMFDGIMDLLPPEPVITTTALGTLTRLSPFSQTLTATGTDDDTITWSVAPGSACPFGLTLDSVTGVLSGVPTGVGPYDFTVMASNFAGSDLLQLTGTITALPFIPTGTATSWVLLSGMWYPATVNVKIGDEFVRAVTRT
jgi:lysophospholipase L1-like esterase